MVNSKLIGGKAKFFFSLLIIYSNLVEASVLKVLTWNIYFLPPIFVGFQLSPEKRLDLIAQKINESEYDVIVLQEVFATDTYNKLREKTKNRYHFTTGKPLKKSNITSNGLAILSKHHIKSFETKFYQNCAWGSADCFSSKGVLRAEIEVKGKIVNIFNTHVQAGNSETKQWVKFDQFSELRDFTDQFKGPQIIVGDLNVSKLDSDPRSYYEMIRILGVENPTDKELVTVDECANKLKNCQVKGEEARKQLDYIFVKNNKYQPKRFEVYRHRGNFKKYFFQKKDLIDLSDHYALGATVNIDGAHDGI